MLMRAGSGMVHGQIVLPEQIEMHHACLALHTRRSHLDTQTHWNTPLGQPPGWFLPYSWHFIQSVDIAVMWIENPIY